MGQFCKRTAFRSTSSTTVSVLALAMACSLNTPAAAQTTTAQPPITAQQNDTTLEPVTPPRSESNHSDEIIVTGSRLSQRQVTDQPIQSVTSQELTGFGATNIGQQLLELPSFGVPANSTFGGQGSYSAGQTFANLYNLGSQRTLTLVNGNRFVSSASSSIFGPVQGSPVDLGQISPGLVERVDVLSVGGAPIYGSDAIAGTVNIILKKNFEGIQLDGSSGISSQGDAQDYNFSLLTGKNFDEGRGNITLNVYYDHQDGLTDAARYITGANAPFFGQAANGNGQTYQLLYGGFRYPGFTNTGIPLVADTIPFLSGAPTAGGNVINAAGKGLYFNKSGQLVPFTEGTPLFNGITEVGGDGFPIGNYGNLLTQSDRVQGTLLGHYDFSDHIHFHGEFWLAHDSASNLTDQPYYSTGLFGASGSPNGNLALSTSNPFLSAADQSTINAAVNGANGTNNASNTFYLARANTDLSTGTFRSATTLYRIVGGLDGEFNVGSHNLTWEATVNYGHVSTTTTQRELDTQNFFNALNAVAGPNGSPVCAPGYVNSPAQTISTTCAPLDIFGVGNESQASLNYVGVNAQTHQVNTQFDAVADIKGELIHLPAGSVQFVLGYEHRREGQSFDPGPFYLGQANGDGTYTSYGQDSPITPVAGSYHTNEGFGELSVPVFGPDMHIPLIHSLDLQGAARYTDNSLTGGFWSYTGGGTYAPFAGLTFRGNYTRSFRSPSVTELFAPNGSVFETANDPCDAGFINGGPNPTRRAANCAAAGITQPFSSNVNNFTIEGTSGGNKSLSNELANSWTAGGVFQPKILHGLVISADYISIDIQNEISDPGLTNEMDACYDSANFPNNSYCGTFTRDATGQVVSFTDNYSNIAIESFRALQASANYSFPLSRLGLPDRAGSISIAANYLHTFKHYTQTGTNDIEQVVNNVTDPKNNISGDIDWATKYFDWMWQGTYNGPTLVNPNVPNSTYDYPRIGAYLVFDSSIGIKAAKNFTMRLIMNNVFNAHVPFPYVLGSPTTSNYARYYDAIIGRYLRVNAEVKF